MSDEDHATPDDDVHLEWSYDLARPFLAHVSLLSAQRSYPTTLSTEEAVFPVSVFLPSRPNAERGIANFLAPPLDWLATPREAEERWGSHYRHDALGGKDVVAIKRLTFAVHAESRLVDPVARAEWGPELLAQEILHNIDTWWENVRTWLEIATNQRLAQIGHEDNDWINPHTRTSIWMIDDSGKRDQLNVGGTALRGPDRVLGVTPEILRDCVALATTPPHLAWSLLRDARALHQAGQLRRAIIDTATAAELAATKRIDELLTGELDPRDEKRLRKARTLGPKMTVLGEVGEQIPQNFDALINARNNAVHEGIDVAYHDWDGPFGAALEFVERHFPLPAAPGSSAPLMCHWSHAASHEPSRPPLFIWRDRF
ncbi:hypothetical protein [Mycolicibacterium llatzerense]|uniref:hypothetical protein n=1 Tax=Mycolicibacterium llatzerense TaxID=280871 RepID=UPI0008DDDF8B|nr:hypothetical protein [Mycolicibacterium llatzerense]